MMIKDQIDMILQKRKLKAQQLREKKENLEKICGCLNDCRLLYTEAKSITDKEFRKQYMNLFAALPSDEMSKDIKELIARIESGIQRFDRDYISIATVGKERQGKSRFLQAVGDLNNLIIPAYDATSCTGATSVIYNRPDMQKKTVKAVIKFRKREKLMEIVRGYLSILDPQWEQKYDLNFDMLGSNSFDNMIDQIDIEEGDAEKGIALSHLQNINKHFSEISDLYGQEDLVLTEEEKIAEHVAQNNGKKITDPDFKAYYKYLAVEKADIYCPFYNDCGKLVLVDTIGIGDTKYGIEEAMLETVDKECDAAIVVTMPMSGVQQPDVDLYNSLRDRFRKRDMKKWLFYLANKNEQINAKRVDTFTGEIKAGKFAVAYCETVDCSNKEEVETKFMSPLLNILLGNMDEIDSAYLSEITDLETQVRQKYFAFLEKLPEGKTLNANVQQGLSAFQKGKECYQKLSADLVNSVIYWGREKDQPNSILWNAVQEILDSLDELVPDAKTLQKTIDGNGSLLPGQLWDDALHYVRNEITDRFIAVDGVLEEETRKFKNSLVQNLYHELMNLTKAQGTSGLPWEKDESANPEAETPDMVEWLKNVMDHVINDKPQYEQIYKAFRFMYRFEFNTRAQLIQEVRRQLYIINPICDREYAKPLYNFHRDAAGKEVNFYLTSRMSIIEENLRHVLAGLYQTPNQAFYAAAEEFYDRLTFASSLNENEKGSKFQSMQDVWGEFFMEYSNQLWSANAQKYQAVNDLVQKFDQIKNELNKEGEKWIP